LPIHFYVNNWRRHFLRITIEVLLSIGLDILEGLNYIHSLNEVHRDLKPQNGHPGSIETDVSSILRI
jgi:serine/threonine protein kinase